MVKKFLFYYRPYKMLLFFIILGSLFTAGLELSFPIIVRYLMNEAIPKHNINELLIWSGALCFLYLLSYGLNYLLQYYGHVMGIKMENAMRRDMFEHLQKMSFSFYDNNKIGQLLARLTNDISEISELAFRAPSDIIVCVISMIGTVFILFWINPWLGFIITLLLVAKSIHTIYMNLKMKRSFKNFRAKSGDITAKAEECLNGIRLIKAFAVEEREQASFEKVSNNYFAAKKESFKILAHFISSMGLFTNFTNLIVMGFGGWLVITARINLSDFVAFFLYIGMFMKPLLRLTAFTEIYQRGMAGFNRFFEIMKTVPEINDSVGAINVGKLHGRIEFKDLSFGYSDNELVLKNINLLIEPGETVAFVGETGAGKTTIANLLLRFYEASAGNILIDGYDIKSYTQRFLRSQIGLVQQDVFLFSESVKYNIAYSKDDAKFTDIKNAAVAASADEFIERLPFKYDTEIGERGVKLSGGQKQRIAIARIFLKNPPIVVLDEATSALDNKTEQQIQMSLEKLAQGRTTLIIAHRLSTIKNADKIIVLDKGKIAEMGTHQSLLALRGIYYRLYNSKNKLA